MAILVVALFSIALIISNIFDMSLLSFFGSFVAGGTLIAAAAMGCYVSKAFSGRIERSLGLVLLAYAVLGIATIATAVVYSPFEVKAEKPLR